MWETSRKHNKERECSDSEVEKVKINVRLCLAQVYWNRSLFRVKRQEDAAYKSSAKHHDEHIRLADNHVG